MPAALVTTESDEYTVGVCVLFGLSTQSHYCSMVVDAVKVKVSINCQVFTPSYCKLPAPS